MVNIHQKLPDMWKTQGSKTYCQEGKQSIKPDEKIAQMLSERDYKINMINTLSILSLVTVNMLKDLLEKVNNICEQVGKSSEYIGQNVNSRKYIEAKNYSVNLTKDYTTIHSIVILIDLETRPM